MKIVKNIQISEISWLRRSYPKSCPGRVGILYQPETRDELIALCKTLYTEKKTFDIIGCTSNIYFRPSYCPNIVVSTRYVNKWEEQDSEIICDCGVLVNSLSKKMIDKGYSGFEGLIDLPGTVAASVYGNSSCYHCSIGKLLLNIDVLLPEGKIVTLSAESLKLGHRTSIFKSKELNGVILSTRLKKIKDVKKDVKELSEKYHMHRITHQPGPANNLGSNFAIGTPNLKLKIVSRVGYLYEKILHILKVHQPYKKRMNFQLSLLGKTELIPYLWDWNRFIWKDEKAHEVFDTYVELYKSLFSNAILEIEVKGNK